MNFGGNARTQRNPATLYTRQVANDQGFDGAAQPTVAKSQQRALGLSVVPVLASDLEG